MKKSLIFLCVLIFGILSVNLASADGCCINAYTSVCQAVMVSQDECCPDNAFAYGDEGALDRAACIADFFFEGEDCLVRPECADGCCCDPLPSQKPAAACIGGVWTPLEEMDSLCEATFCEQFDIEEPEPPLTLPCDDPFPEVTANPVKGEKAVQLTFGVPCDYRPNYFKIERLGPDGAWIVLEPQLAALAYGDFDPELMWGATYQYRVTAVYEIANAQLLSFDRAITLTMGDHVCWGVHDELPFCVAADYFIVESLERPPFIPYFRDIEGIPEDQIELYINNTFGDLFFNAYSCDLANMAHLFMNCEQEGGMCVMQSDGVPECYAKGDCEGVHPFGLFTTSRDQCELDESGNNKYCFFDRSQSVVGKCYECDPFMACYDYKAEATCQANNCRANGANDCVWEWVDSDLGIGVCKSMGQDNCKFCESSGTGFVESFYAHNYIFNRCTSAKLEALQVPGYPCGSVPEVSCRDLICEVIEDQAECSGPVRLDDDNMITRGSEICNGAIKVCTWSEPRRTCIKDADGDTSADCDDGDVACQRDRYPPRTELHSYAQLTTADNINFKIFDKSDSQDVEQEVQLADGYEIYMCSYTGISECGPLGYNGIASNPFSYYKLPTVTMNVGDLLIENVLDFGRNTIKFFTVDPSQNVEVIKTETVNVDVIGGPLSVFVKSPGENAFVNTTDVVFHIIVKSARDRIWKAVLKEAGEVVATFYEGSPDPLELDVQRVVNVGEDGVHIYELEVRAGELAPHITTIRVEVDTIPPIPPVLNPIEELFRTNIVTVNGLAEPLSDVQIWGKYNDGIFALMETVEVDEAGGFSVQLLLDEGDYELKAKAIDKAKNPSDWSNILTFTYVESAPTFDVDPPDGAIRGYVEQVQVDFTLKSVNVPLDKDLTLVELFIEGVPVAGTPDWLDNTTLVFTPADWLGFGFYGVHIMSVDILGNELEATTEFEIGQVPIISTSWDAHIFKTREPNLPVFGFVDGQGHQVVEAYYLTYDEVPHPFGTIPTDYFEFDLEIPLREGENNVTFIATNELDGTAREPYKVELDSTPPLEPEFGFG